MKYLSVCSGIEAISCAWEPLGFQPIGFSEIDKFPSSVLAYRYQNIPNHGDMQKLPAMVITRKIEAPNILVGGTPCQSFSIAGLRKGLDDPRGNLALKYVETANAIDFIRGRDGLEPCLTLWENVPGVLSDNENAFGCFLAALSGEDDPLVAPGGKWTNAGCVHGPQRSIAWRILDAQYFGVPQRRRRIFVVASAGDRTRPLEILFEREGVCWYPEKSGKKRSGVAAAFTPSTHTGYREGVGSIRANGGDIGGGSENLIATYDMRGNGDGNTVNTLTGDHASRPTDFTPVVCMSTGQGSSEIGIGIGTTLNCNHEAPILAFSSKDNGRDVQEDSCPTLRSMGHSGSHANGGGQTAVAFAENHRMTVRRITPKEAERLQGFPDDWTKIPYGKKTSDDCPDGPRYKAIGNSMAVPCVSWIGKRIIKSIKAEKSE